MIRMRRGSWRWKCRCGFNVVTLGGFAGPHVLVERDLGDLMRQIGAVLDRDQRSIMSSDAMPPAQVMQLRSMAKDVAGHLHIGNSSRKERRFSQWMVQRRPSRRL
jgi:hypothetical protein